MKKIFLILTIFAFAFSSCITDGNFLEYDETTVYEADAIRKSFDRTTQYVTDIYSYLPTDFYSVGYAMRSSACDEGEYVWPTSDIHIMTNGRWSPRRTVDDGWSTYYKGIRACNLYLEEFNNSTFDENKYDQTYQDQMTRYHNFEWEVRFLRAYFYFELLRRYGDVPLETRTISTEEANSLSRTPFDEVVQFIVDECDVVKANITPSYAGTIFKEEISRVPKAAAYALKTRVLLYAASPLHNPDNDRSRWLKAATAAADMLKAMDAGEAGFKSYLTARLPAYATVLAPTNFSLTTSEVIFATRTANSSTLEANNFPIGYEGGTSGNCPTHNLVEKFGITQELLDANPAQPWTNRDPRLALIVALNNNKPFTNYDRLQIYEGGANGLPKTGATNTGYYLKKFLFEDVNLKAGQSVTYTHAFPLFRYAEVFLNYAEAVNELYGPDEVPSEIGYTMTALTAANKVRYRTGFVNTTVPQYTVGQFDQNTFRNELRDERWREFAFEDHRFWDIRRWKIGAETQRDIKRLRIQRILGDDGKYSFVYKVETDANARVWDDKMYFYPIPQSEMDKNKNLTQNPGWE
ncbi:MAG: RagB/SusD family nutrient uptake outer membrane protein [Dysgonamonadaceae bacterium]|jgi:hypothetical protein|nr:RagB/SusD family nutrient uptake outer membrane protein [Dysgonamonadaceae bacterium]